MPTTAPVRHVTARAATPAEITAPVALTPAQQDIVNAAHRFVLTDAVYWIGWAKHPLPAAPTFSLRFTATPYYACAQAEPDDPAHAREFTGDTRMLWAVQCNGQTVAIYRNNLNEKVDPRRDELVIWWR